MQAIEASEFRRKWNGSECDHAFLEKEYAQGLATGDYVCTRCGETGWGKDWVKKE